MFFVLAVLAACGYALQNALMISVYRRMDALAATAFRGMTLALTMLPLLCFVPWSDFFLLQEVGTELLLASFFATLGNWFQATAYAHLTVGLATAFYVAFLSILSGLLGYLLFDETLSGSQILFIGLLLLSVSLLALSKSEESPNFKENLPLGLTASMLAGLSAAGAYVGIGAVSRNLHPFLAGYAWEATVAIVAVILCLLRQIGGAKPLLRITGKDWFLILVFSSPTVIGTGCYTLAVSTGPVAIVTAVLTTTVVLNTVLAYLFYKERLTTRQWCFVLLVCAVLLGLKLS